VDSPTPAESGSVFDKTNEEIQNVCDKTGNDQGAQQWSHLIDEQSSQDDRDHDNDNSRRRTPRFGHFVAFPNDFFFR
jgi:hypothetical protein